MKTFKATPEVAEKLKELNGQIHEICVANGLPYVSAVVLEDDGEQFHMASGGYAHAEDAPAPNKLIAALELLAGDEVDAQVAGYFIARNRNGGECPCEGCTAERQAAAH